MFAVQHRLQQTQLRQTPSQLTESLFECKRRLTSDGGQAPRPHQRRGIGIEAAFAGPMPPAGKVAPCAARMKFTTDQ